MKHIYLDEYIEVKGMLHPFIKLLQEKFNMKYHTARRRFYDVNKTGPNFKITHPALFTELIDSIENLLDLIDNHCGMPTKNNFTDDVQKLIIREQKKIDEWCVLDQDNVPDVPKVEIIEDMYFEKFIGYTILDEGCSKPDKQKLLTYHDMKRMGYKITKEYLHKYGFSREEIEWLSMADEKIK